MIRRETAIKNRASLNDKESHWIRWKEISEVRFKNATALTYGYVHFIRTDDPPRTFWQKLSTPSWMHKNAITFSVSQQSVFSRFQSVKIMESWNE